MLVNKVGSGSVVVVLSLDLLDLLLDPDSIALLELFFMEVDYLKYQVEDNVIF